MRHRMAAIHVDLNDAVPRSIQPSRSDYLLEAHCFSPASSRGRRCSAFPAGHGPSPNQQQASGAPSLDCNARRTDVQTTGQGRRRSRLSRTSSNSHSGAPRSGEPEIRISTVVVIDSGFASFARARNDELRLRDELLVGIGLEPFHAAFVAVTGILDAAERRFRRRDHHRIHPDHAGLDGIADHGRGLRR